MGVPQSCFCDECPKCISRKRAQVYRARARQRRPPKPPCPRCGGEVKSTNGRTIYCSQRCARQFGTRRINDERRALVAAHKAARGCAICGLTEPTYVLDLHHLDPTQKWRSFGGSLTHSWQRLEAELEKCVVLCCNHHRMVEAGDLTL
jgi:hypothetical protein